MKVQAYMPVYNEVDVLPYVLAHLHAQGVAVHALDGWSTDGSYEMLATTPGVRVERFPAEGPVATQVCRAILHRIEELAAASGADWCMLSDADEWRRSSRTGETLAQGLERIAREGWNAVDFRVFAFFCTDGNWQGNPEQYFRYFNETDMICQIPNTKAWQNRGRVDLATHGGHLVQFPGMRLSPERWTMKHYPFRTPVQAQRKIAVRLVRRCQEEHRDGWGVHYDEFRPGFEFCWNPQALREWPADRLREGTL